MQRSIEHRNYWLEVWDPWHERWIHLDPLRCLLNDPLAVTVLPWWTAVERPAPQPERLDTNLTSGDEQKQRVAKSRSVANASVRGTVSGRLRTRQALLSPEQRPRDADDAYSTDKSAEASSSGQESDASGPLAHDSSITTVKRSARQRAERVVSYIFAIDGGFVRDVTRRYVARFQPVLETRSLDGHRYWTEEVLPLLNPYRPGSRLDSENDDDELQQERLRDWCHLDALEREEFLTLNESEPIPQSLSALKNHPAFVLEEHLKKYEALHPKVEVGTIRRIHSNGILQTIPVYRRRDVHVLHTRERWFRECRIVRPDEQPYKIVQSFMSRFRQQPRGTAARA
ncbi:hypothetical protein F1559_003138 [Cyanidiococcus yangmingshanensis]|uniref:Rad4 beta-hairpin domain-containing protein n=1 Tax=Cyanidiococcus yangmingshanensis TaxID=2690220 RepID=A0A7J7ILS2_9RHOD|nr:hypothetical protein F1559_003138 [Cyanidiococcus yangmingshanensis]